MKNIYKIWFAKNNDQPLGGALNEYRLSLHRVRFPNDTLHLITNLSILSDKNKKYVAEFCQKYKIQLIDLKDIEKALNVANYRDKEIQK